MFGSSRRFIAGAVCPQCRAEDRIQVYRADEQDHRECVACGWRDCRIEPQPSYSATEADRAADPVRLIERHEIPGKN